MNFDIVVVRQNMLAELYGAHLWKTYRGAELLLTPPITQMDQDLLEKIKGKNVLVVGGYYRENMEQIVASGKSVSVFYNSSDSVIVAEGYKALLGTEYWGFVTWTAGVLTIQEDHVLKMAKYLDEYLYGYPSEKAMCFQNGVYVVDQDNDLDKLLTIKSNEDVETTISKGKEKLVANRRIADQRLKCAKSLTFKAGGDTYTALVSIGDSPVVDTCLLLAEKASSGIGMLFRYDLSTGKTFISTRTTKESGVDAGILMKKLVRGGGSKPMGGGSISGLFFPEQLLV